MSKSPRLTEVEAEAEAAPEPRSGTLLTITIADPGLAKKSSEVAYALGCLATVVTELGRGNGNATAGTITAVGSNGAANTAKGAWTYTPSATLP